MSLSREGMNEWTNPHACCCFWCLTPSTKHGPQHSATGYFFLSSAWCLVKLFYCTSESFVAFFPQTFQGGNTVMFSFYYGSFKGRSRLVSLHCDSTFPCSVVMLSFVLLLNERKGNSGRIQSVKSAEIRTIYASRQPDAQKRTSAAKLLQITVQPWLMS